MKAIRSIFFIVFAAALPLLAADAPAPQTFSIDKAHSDVGFRVRHMMSNVRGAFDDFDGTIAIDRTNLGKYLFEVRDASGRVVYSRGFASVYGEWETTDEAKSMNRTFHESLRFPAPEGPVKVVIRKRDAKNELREVWTADVDPRSMFVDRSSPPAPGALIEIEKNGASAVKVDVLLLGDGYTAAERGKFERDARRMLDILFATPPFKERRRDFNVWGLVPAAAESGISRPSTGIYRASPVGTTYDAFGSERYVLTSTTGRCGRSRRSRRTNSSRS